VLWKKTTKLKLCGSRSGVFFDIVGEMRMVVIAGFEGYFGQAFAGSIVPDLFKRRLISNQVNKLLRTDAQVLIELPL